MALDPYQRLNWRGVVANRRTIEMLEITELRALMDLAPLRIPQGSYTTGVSASAGTHSGGGALDVSVRDLTSTQRDRVVRELRETSFAAWYRPYLAGVWPAHIHAIAIGDKEMSAAAAEQVVQYRNGQNGLANHGPDNGPDVPIHVYRQDIDMSYYGPEHWDQADFDRLFDKWGNVLVGSYNRPDTDDPINPSVEQALRAAHWVRTLLTDEGQKTVLAKNLYTADGIIPNVGVTSPSGAFMTLASAISNMENTQDVDTKVLAEVKADTAAILGKLPPPA
jgi:hypothetical protein